MVAGAGWRPLGASGRERVCGCQRRCYRRPMSTPSPRLALLIGLLTLLLVGCGEVLPDDDDTVEVDDDDTVVVDDDDSVVVDDDDSGVDDDDSAAQPDDDDLADDDDVVVDDDDVVVDDDDVTDDDDFVDDDDSAGDDDDVALDDDDVADDDDSAGDDDDVALDDDDVADDDDSAVDDDDFVDDDDSAVDDDDDSSGDDDDDSAAVDAAVGITYCLDWNTVTFSEPPGFVAALAFAGLPLDEVPLLLQPTALDDLAGTIEAMSTAAQPFTCTQNTAISTQDLTAAGPGSWADPHFEIGPVDSSLQTSAGGGGVALYDMVLTGDFTPGRDQIVDGTIYGELDITAHAAACPMVGWTCPPCTSDPSVTCVVIAGSGAVWTDNSLGPLVYVP